jgi:hypothetical protein
MESIVAMFLVSRLQTGPEWDPARPMEGQSGWADHAAFMDRLVEEGFIVLGGPIGGGPRVMIAVEADSEAEVRSTFSADPWSESHLLLDAIEPWTIRLDGRSA